MPTFLDPRGRSTYGIGICGRCSRKMFLEELSPDPNSPGLLVCAEDLDVLDPYRLPARQTEQITLPYNRPDVNIDVSPSDAAADIPNFAQPNVPIPDPAQLPWFDVLARRWVDPATGQAIVDADGNYIDIDLQIYPRDLP